MGLSTKNIKTVSNESKGLEPGNNVVKVNRVFLDQPSFLADQGGYFVNMEMETKPIEGFEGFPIDKDDPSKGFYKGRVGTVKHAAFSEYDHEANGVTYNRDERILMFIKRLCDALGDKANKWFEEADGKYNTIEAFVEGFNKSKVFKDIWLKVCIGGREYENDKGFTNYDLSLVKPDKGRHAFGNLADTKIQLYEESKHIYKSKSSSKPKTTDITLDDDPLGGNKGSENFDFDFEN